MADALGSTVDRCSPSPDVRENGVASGEEDIAGNAIPTDAPAQRPIDCRDDRRARTQGTSPARTRYARSLRLCTAYCKSAWGPGRRLALQVSETISIGGAKLGGLFTRWVTISDDLVLPRIGREGQEPPVPARLEAHGRKNSLRKRQRGHLAAGPQSEHRTFGG